MKVIRYLDTNEWKRNQFLNVDNPPTTLPKPRFRFLVEMTEKEYNRIVYLLEKEKR